VLAASCAWATDAAPVAASAPIAEQISSEYLRVPRVNFSLPKKYRIERRLSLFSDVFCDECRIAHCSFNVANTGAVPDPVHRESILDHIIGKAVVFPCTSGFPLYGMSWT
jgi:hypothetical protein